MLIGNALAIPRRRNIGLRIPHSAPSTFDNSTQKTFLDVFVLAADFEAFRILYANAGTGANTWDIGAGYAMPMANLSDPAVTSQNWNVAPGLPLTYGGASTFTKTVPAAVGGFGTPKGIAASDWMRRASLARDDGGIGSILGMRHYLSTAATINITGAAANSRTNWVTDPEGYNWITRVNDGNVAATGASFVSTTNINQSPVLGVQYESRGNVCTVMVNGDSTKEGIGTTYRGKSEYWRALRSLQTELGIPMEMANLGWAGTGGDIQWTYLEGVLSVLGTGFVPDAVVGSAGSINDFTPPATQVMRDALDGTIGMLQRVCSQYGVPGIVLSDIPPQNVAARNFGATDSFRQGRNAVTRALASRGIIIHDRAAIYDGIIASGQADYVIGYSSDGTHPNDTGSDAAMPGAKLAIRTALGL